MLLHSQVQAPLLGAYALLVDSGILRMPHGAYHRYPDNSDRTKDLQRSTDIPRDEVPAHGIPGTSQVPVL